MTRSVSAFFIVKPGMAMHAVWTALAVFIFFLPVGGTTALRHLMLAAIVVILTWLFWQRRHWPDFPLLSPWLVYAGIALFSLIHAIDPRYSLAEIKTEILLPFLTFWIAVNIVRDDRDMERFLFILTFSATFLIAFNLTTATLGETTKDGLVGSLNSGVGTFSTYLVVVMPFLILLAAMKTRDGTTNINVAIGLLVCAAMAALFVTLNRQAFVALAAELAIIPLLSLTYLVRLPRRYWLALFVLIVVVLLLFFVVFFRRDPLVAETFTTALARDVRWETWKLLFVRLGEQPWIGSGFGIRTFQFLFPELASSSPFWHAHNFVLNKGIQMGLPGIAAFLWLMFSAPYHLFVAGRKNSRVGLVAVAIIALTVGMFVKNMTDDFFYRDGSLLFWLLAGACLGYSHGMAKDGRGQP